MVTCFSHHLSLFSNPIFLTAPRLFHPPGDGGGAGGGLAWLTASFGGSWRGRRPGGRRRPTPRASDHERRHRQHCVFSKFADPHLQNPRCRD